MYKQIDSNKRKSVLLIVIFIIVIIALGYLIGAVYQEGYAFVPLAIIFSLFGSVGGYYFSDSIVLAASQARPITKEQNREIYNLVENLAITAGIPLPRIYLIQDSAMNAFATGRDPQHAVVVLTTGIIQRLDRSELEGVIAHELSHVKNFDIRFATLVVVFVGIISLLADWFIRFSFFGGRRKSDHDSGQIGAILAIAGLVFAILAPLFAKLVQLSVSRKREFLADASGALLTRYPEGLASALRKIGADREPLEAANRATAHLYFANPFKKQSLSRFLSTHPPVEERIKALVDMAQAR